MLVWHHIILVFGVQRLVLRRDVDLVVGQLGGAEVFEEVDGARMVEVDVGVVGIFGLWRGC
jgi:hypothetical protein